MKKLLLALTLASSALLVTACSEKSDNASTTVNETTPPTQMAPAVPETPTAPPAVENESELALDWSGVYTGVFPCADCEGINVTLTLNENKTFKLDSVYIKNGKTELSDTENGTFVWLKQRPVIKLTSNGETSFYMIGEGFAKRLDSEGNPIESELNYTLIKKN